MLNVNSTASGGGVAEMLRTLLAYARGAGVDAQWIVIQGDPHFFEITKRVHNNLHGAPGDGGPLGSDERRHYEEILRAKPASAKGRYLRSITLASTMGPGLKVDTSKIRDLLEEPAATAAV